MAKGPEAFRTISEAADELNVPQHVLRFWETKFAFIRPMKRAGGRRFYRPSDIAVLRGVRRLLHDEGYTIKGVQRLHREQGVRRLIAAGEGQSLAAPVQPPVPVEGRLRGDLGLAADSLTDGARDRLAEILAELEATKARLDAMLKK